MLSFFRERKNAKLVKAHLDNFNSLPPIPSNPLQAEALTNLYLDIIDSFTLLRDSFNFEQSLITSPSDYRLERLHGMPGKVIQTIHSCIPLVGTPLLDLPGKTPNLASYFERALFRKLSLELCDEAIEYSHERYLSLLRLDTQLHHFGRNQVICIQPSEFFNLMTSFAYKQCVDIYVLHKDLP